MAAFKYLNFYAVLFWSNPGSKGDGRIVPAPFYDWISVDKSVSKQLLHGLGTRYQNIKKVRPIEELNEPLIPIVSYGEQCSKETKFPHILWESNNDDYEQVI